MNAASWMSKFILLSKLFFQSSSEFRDRVIAILEVKYDKLFSKSVDYQSLTWQQGLEFLTEDLFNVFQNYFTEAPFLEIESEVRQILTRLYSQTSPFNFSHNADSGLARLCYLVCRVIQPTCVLETGVAYGVTTAYILKALEVNQNGILYSIDLPPLGHRADQFVGILVPESLRERWKLSRGTSRQLLKSTLRELQRIDVFVHDSLHTYRNIRFELEAVTPYLANPSIVLVDDIEGNRAFLEWVKRASPFQSLVIKENEKDSLMGMAIFRDEQ